MTPPIPAQPSGHCNPLPPNITHRVAVRVKCDGCTSNWGCEVQALPDGTPKARNGDTTLTPNCSSAGAGVVAGPWFQHGGM